MAKRKTTTTASARRQPATRRKITKKPPELLHYDLHNIASINEIAVSLGIETAPGKITDLRDGLKRVLAHYKKPLIRPIHTIYHNKVDRNIKAPDYDAITGPKLTDLAIDLIIDYANTERANSLASDGNASPLPTNPEINTSITPSPTKPRFPKTPSKNTCSNVDGVKRKIM